MKLSNRHGRLVKQQRDGFTLLELLLALIIFVGAAAILSRLILLGIENAEYSRWQAEAAIIAENRFQELEAGILTISDVGTATDPDFPDWEFDLQAASMDITGLYLVTVQVKNVKRNSDRELNFSLSRVWLEESELETTETESESGSETGTSAETQSQ